jgi:hypothetical protein
MFYNYWGESQLGYRRHRHCERSEAIHCSTCDGAVDCFVAALLAMTIVAGSLP